MRERIKGRNAYPGILSVLLSMLLLTALVLPLGSSALAADPVNMPEGVTGRILPTYLSGDTSEWVEIARNGDYSLILRRDVLSVGQVKFDSRDIDAYQISAVRDIVNNWYKNTLSGTARMRDFATKANPIQDIGYFAVVSNGYSVPSGQPAKTGDDVAFLLSFAEAAMFCSDQYATNYQGTSWNASPANAQANYKLINKSTKPLDDFWWLRSPGHYYSTAKCASSVGSHTTPMAGMVYASSSQAGYPYVRPAIWVNSGIFDEKGTVNVSYLDAVTGAELAPTETFMVQAGPYGPYAPKEFRFYLAGELAPYSDSASGTINMNQVKNITYLYTRGKATVMVVCIDLTNYVTLQTNINSVPAGDYGPISPPTIPGYDPGQPLAGSAPIQGVVDIGQTVVIVYGYQRQTMTIHVIHQTPSGLELWKETFTIPTGAYGPYNAYTFPRFHPGVWDEASDPPSGYVTTPYAVITIVYVYDPEVS